MRRLLFVVVAAGLIFMVISSLRGPSVQDAMKAAGCRAPLLYFQNLSNRSVLALSSTECHGPDRSVLGGGEAIDVIAAAAWSSPATRFDTLFITVYRTQEKPAHVGSTDREITRAELESRFGPRSPSLDRAEGVKGPSISELGWILLPLLVVGSAVLPIYAGVQSARAGLVLIWMRR